ncbi:hypothetical protein A33M_4352 [Rhodovulum sp. PH10]|uniref:EF-hand domain-containing protein n=1 Tax=Rhodovulum sp. PH10 TaxID=1187851 RepID=UPI00027C2DBC|nr:EF-hand domain-containing protein [Rhodovulum sp. PH10]EJW10515.1 hypothetical protein A33M_4352 [Rhodovulum sp. PH10]
MMFLAGSALTALGALSSLTDLVSSGSGDKKSGAGTFTLDDQTTAGSSSAVGKGGAVSSDTMRAILAMQGQNGPDGMAARLFAAIDADGNGQVSESELADAVSATGSKTADDGSLFKMLDQNQDGSVGQDELTAALRRHGAHRQTVMQPSGTALDLFQRMIQQQADMLAATTAAGGTVAKSI